jgi:resuscitation-promoting factor RpfB
VTTTRPTTGAGWFPDPYDSRFVRYWDGMRWTEHTRPAPAPQAQAGAAPLPAAGANSRPWWQTWWAVVPALLLCFPVGLVGLWVRQGTSRLIKVGVTAVVAVVVIAAISGGNGADSQSLSGTPPSTTVNSTSPSPTPAPTSEPQRARVPALTGANVSDARAELRSRHLKVANIERRPSALPAGTVLAQSFRSGKQLGWGSGVALVVASPLPRVPSVAGRVQAVAIHLVRSAGFRVTVTHETVTSGADGVVLRVSPTPGQSLRPHSMVTIVVAHLVRPFVAAPSSQPPSSGSGCTPGYSPCLPPASDYDCAGGSGDGPEYAGFEHVTGSDPYDLDADGDGLACES